MIGNTQLVLHSDVREQIGSEMLDPKKNGTYLSSVER